MGWDGENSVAAIAMQVCFVAVSGFLSLRDSLYRLRGSFCRFFVFFGAVTHAFGHVRPRPGSFEDSHFSARSSQARRALAMTEVPKALAGLSL